MLIEHVVTELRVGAVSSRKFTRALSLSRRSSDITLLRGRNHPWAGLSQLNLLDHVLFPKLQEQYWEAKIWIISDLSRGRHISFFIMYTVNKSGEYMPRDVSWSNH